MAGTVLMRNLTCVVASYTGTGSSINFDFGFVPSHAHGINAASGLAAWDWNSSMSNNVTGGSSGVFGQTLLNGLVSTISAGTGGITVLDGSAGNGIGLVIGTNTIISSTGHGYLVTAFR